MAKKTATPEETPELSPGLPVHIHENSTVMLGRIVQVNEDATLLVEIQQGIGQPRLLYGVHRRQGDGNGWVLV